MKPYILDDASTLEYQRLDLMSKILDPWTREYLTALGVSHGWQCPELSSGNGSIAEWLCETVGPSGSVTTIDINPVLLELIPAQNLTVEQMDVRTGGLPANAYDLVTCRALLHQISDYAPAVLAQMAAALKLGGWLLIQEPDFHLAPTTEPEVWATTWKEQLRIEACQVLGIDLVGLLLVGVDEPQLASIGHQDLVAALLREPADPGRGVPVSLAIRSEPSEASTEGLWGRAQPAFLDHLAALCVDEAQVTKLVAEVQSGRHQWSLFATIIHGPILLP